MADVTSEQIKNSVLRQRRNIDRELKSGKPAEEIIDEMADDLIFRNRGVDPAIIREGVFLAVMEVERGVSGTAAPSGYPTGPIQHHGPHFLGNKHFVVKIIHPDPHNSPNIEIHQEASTGRRYHEKIVFDAEITGGTPGFWCKWEISRNGGPFRDLWPYDQNGNAMQWSQEFSQRDYKFFKGGLDRVRNNFHYEEGLTDQMNDPWASLEPGTYQVRIIVVDRNGMEAHAFTNFTVGGLIPERDYFQVRISSPFRSGGHAEIELHTDISTGGQWHEDVRFDCETTHGTTPYRYQWTIDNQIVWAGTGDRFKTFNRGGQNHPVADLDIPFASLAEGRHTISVSVTDHGDRTANATGILIVTSKPRGRMRAVITQPRNQENPRETFSKKLEGEGERAYHDPITFDCEVSGGSGNYDYKWTATSLDENTQEATDEIPLNFVSRKTFSRGGQTHPVNNDRDPEASLAEGLYQIRVVVTDINNTGGRAEAETWIRIGEEQGPTTRSLASYMGMRPRAARIGGGIMPGRRGSFVRRQGVSGARELGQQGPLVDRHGNVERQDGGGGGAFRRFGSELGERAMYRMQHPTAGSGKLARVLKNETKEGAGVFGSESSRGKIYTNPAVQAAINQGKREVNRWAKQLFSPEFERTRRELRTLTDNWTRRRNEWLQVRNRVYQQFNRGFFSRMWSNLRSQGGADALTNIIAQQQQQNNINETQARLLIDEVNQAYNKFTKTEEDLMNFSSKRAAEMQTRIDTKMKELSKDVAGRVIYRFKLNRIPGADAFVNSELELEATKVAESMITRGRDNLSGAVGAMRSASMRMKTFGSAYFGLKDYLWQIISAPWMWGFAFAIVQFYFILTYVGFNPTYLWLMPMITAGFTFLVNFADTTRPFDWFNHLASGAIIGYSAVLFMLALGFDKFTFIAESTGWFWGIWIFFSFIGIFQFYHTGGFRIAMQGGIIILLFAYVALGPYSGYYHQTIDQVRGPVEIAWGAAYKTFGDVYLLATNPTEWYARQQVQNVRPEKSLGTSKGVEVASFDSLPQSVPSGQEFAITTVLKNEGTLDNATNIKVLFTCNQWCSVAGVVPTDEPSTKKTGNEYMIMNAEDAQKSILYKGESLVTSFSGFRANSIRGRENEYRLAKVTMNVTYTYSTTSSLFAEVINTKEFEKRTNEGKGFRNVLATGKNSPAQLSLNVGPQPLLAGKNSLLLVAVSNSRDKSSVILPEGSDIILRMPRSVGSGLNCDGAVHDPLKDGDPEETQMEVVRYKILPRGNQNKIEIRADDFNSIFPFICNFMSNDLRTRDIDANEPLSQTGLITAELPSYEFTTTHEKDIPVTVPLGILFDPYDATCRQCGSGNDCLPASCHASSSSGGKCYYDHSKEIPGSDYVPFTEGATNVPLANVCRSCGTEPACDQFIDPTTCNDEDGECNINCEWDSSARACQNNGGKLSGSLSNVKLLGTTISKIIQASEAAGFDRDGTKHVLAVAAQESGYTMITGDGGDSIGIFQLNRKAHPEWYRSGACPNGQTPYDEDCNIKLGVNYIRNLYSDHYNDLPKSYACKSTSYRGWDAVFRWYNGWNTNCNSGDINYVDNVNGWLSCNTGIARIASIPQACVNNAIVQPASHPLDSEYRATYTGYHPGYENLLEAEFIGKGSTTFCSITRLSASSPLHPDFKGVCTDGEGGCTTDTQCGLLQDSGRQIFTPIGGNGNTISFRCVKDGVDEVRSGYGLDPGAGICCMENQQTSRCIELYKSWAGLSQNSQPNI